MIFFCVVVDLIVIFFVGFDKIRKAKNTPIETFYTVNHDTGSMKYERKATKEQKKWLDNLDENFDGVDESSQISTMVLPGNVDVTISSS